jgi:hypothetical protein
MSFIVFIDPRTAEVDCYEKDNSDDNCRSSPPCGGCQSCMQLQHVHWGGVVGYTEEELPLERVKAMVKQCALLHKKGSENAGCSCKSPNKCQLGIWPRDGKKAKGVK